MEIRLARVVAGQDGRRQLIELFGSQQESLGAGRIVQDHTVGAESRVVAESRIGDRLLVNHLGTGRAADLRQLTSDGAGLGQSQGFRR